MDRKVLTASEGMLLTDGTIYVKRIELGDWDSAENYTEISVEEYEKILQALEELEEVC